MVIFSYLLYFRSLYFFPLWLHTVHIGRMLLIVKWNVHGWVAVVVVVDTKWGFAWRWELLPRIMCLGTGLVSSIVYIQCTIR